LEITVAEITMSNPSWYLIYTNPKQEDRTDKNLRAWNVETFAPKLKEHHSHPFTGEPTCLIKPLFPRYIFARFSLSGYLHKVRFTRGVQGLISFGDGPALVDDEVIAYLKSRVKEDGFVRNSAEFERGDRVLIETGPFSGLAGIFERETQDEDRVRILLEAVSYQVHATIERSRLKRA
jgi:transcriptional antiterminator RfaH